jgi:hypothetical protein
MVTRTHEQLGRCQEVLDKMKDFDHYRGTCFVFLFLSYMTILRPDTLHHILRLSSSCCSDSVFLSPLNAFTNILTQEERIADQCPPDARVQSSLCRAYKQAARIFVHECTSNRRCTSNTPPILLLSTLQKSGINSLPRRGCSFAYCYTKVLHNTKTAWFYVFVLVVVVE